MPSEGGQGGGLGAPGEAMAGGEPFPPTQHPHDVMLPWMGMEDPPSKGKGRDEVFRAVITVSFKALNSFCNAVLCMRFLLPC